MTNSTSDMKVSEAAGDSLSGSTARPAEQWPKVALLAGGHMLVDGYCSIVTPLLAYMGLRLGISDAWAAGFFAAMAIGASFSQVFWGYLCDRFGGRWALVFSPMVAGMVVGIGWTNTYWLIVLLILLAGAGTGAYHPVCGALAGTFAEPRRALGVALFVAAGMAGVALAPIAITQLVSRTDLANIWPLFLPAPLLSLTLWLAFRGVSLSTGPHEQQRFSLRVAFGKQTKSVLLLFVTAVMRAFPISAYHVAVPFMVAQRFDDIRATGYILACFTAGVGIGGVVGSSLAGKFNERKLLIGSMMVCWPVLLIFSFTEGWWLLPAAGAAGLTLGSTVPLAISMGQRLAPRGAQVFSAMMMGLAWGLAGVSAPLIIPHLMSRWGFAYATACCSVALLPAIIAAWRLPDQEGGPQAV